MWLSEANDAYAHGCEHCLRSVTRVKLFVDRCEVVLHGLAADEQLRRDLRGAQAVGDELQHFLFARCQRRSTALARSLEFGEDRRGELGRERDIAARGLQ